MKGLEAYQPFEHCGDGGRGEIHFDQRPEVQVFRRRGFAVVPHDRQKLERQGILRQIYPGLPWVCIDDRNEIEGLKLPGGIYFFAAESGSRGVDGTRAGIARATTILGLQQVGHVHGDTEHGVNGCRWAKIWQEKKVGRYKLMVPLEEAAQIVQEAGGVYDTLSGRHNANEFMVNTVYGTYVGPGYLSADVWLARSFVDYERSLYDMAKLAQELHIRQVGVVV